MTKNEEYIYVFALKCALNQRMDALIPTKEFLRRAKDFRPKTINLFIADTSYALCRDWSGWPFHSKWHDFLDKLLIHKFGKPIINGFKFKESRLFVHNKRIFRLEAYSTKCNKYLYVAKELVVDRKIKLVEVAWGTGCEPRMVYDKIKRDVEKYANNAVTTAQMEDEI